jgi:ribosomal protein L23
MESNTQYLGKRVFIYYERINILLMSYFTKTEIKYWVELFFGVEVAVVNNHRLPRKSRRMAHILGDIQCITDV